MKQFYYFLAQGQTKSEALRSAKLELLHTGSALANPRYWAAFVLTGSGLTPVPRPVSWSIVLFAGAAILALLALVMRPAVRAAPRSPQTAGALIERHPR